MRIFKFFPYFFVFILLLLLIFCGFKNNETFPLSAKKTELNNYLENDKKNNELEIGANLINQCVAYIDPGYYFPQSIVKKEKIVPGTQKGLYLTGYSLGIEKKRFEIYELIEKSELNSIVFNAKDDSGKINYFTKITAALESGTANNLYDIDEIIYEMNKRDIYSIARIVVFKDEQYMKAHPEFAIKDIRNGKPLYLEGSLWPDIFCEEYWSYIIDIAKELSEKGVDEIQFDYIRSPAKGNTQYADYTFNKDNLEKSQAIKKFLVKVNSELKDYDIKISADVFGFVLIENNDQGIGQLIEEIAPYLDYLYPMPYPSHYSKGFLGYSLPEEHPYEVVKYTLEKGLARLNGERALIIPWIQAFGLKIPYTKNEILEQLKASEDLGIKGFLFWNASNKYGIVEEAVEERYKFNDITN